MTKILVVNDDLAEAALISAILTETGFEVTQVHSGAQALTTLEKDTEFAGLVLDLIMPDLDGLGVLAALKDKTRALAIIALASTKSTASAASALNLGAADFCTTPVDPARLITSLRNALKMRALETSLSVTTNRQHGKFRFCDLIGSSSAITKTIERAAKAAQGTMPILLEGERGTGKSLLAQAIKNQSPRSGRSFHTFHCADTQNNAADLNEIQIAAHRGTLFLTEIGCLNAQAQQNLARVLTPTETKKQSDFRLIASTSRRLLAMAKSGRFHPDLYSHLNIYPIFVPPLRERKPDIPALAAHFITCFTSEQVRPEIHGCTPAALELLGQYDWPGNIAQLQSVIFRALSISNSAMLGEEDFPQLIAALKDRQEIRAGLQQTQIASHAPTSIDAQPKPSTPNNTDRFLSADDQVKSLANVEKELIAFAMQKHNGQMSKTARALEIGRSTLYRKLKEYDLIDAETKEKTGRAA